MVLACDDEASSLAACTEKVQGFFGTAEKRRVALQDALSPWVVHEGTSVGCLQAYRAIRQLHCM